MIKEILDVRTGKREQVGGSGGELKLVATGTFHSNEEGQLLGTLDNPIEYNKLYLVEYYIDNTGDMYNTIYLSNTYGTSLSPFGVINYDNDSNAEAFLHISGDSVIIKCNNVIPYLDREADYIKVYELPFTLGGAE